MTNGPGSKDQTVDHPHGADVGREEPPERRHHCAYPLEQRFVESTSERWTVGGELRFVESSVVMIICILNGNGHAFQHINTLVNERTDIAKTEEAPPSRD